MERLLRCLILLVPLAFAACTNTGPKGPLNDIPTAAEFLAMESDEERVAAVEEAQADFANFDWYWDDLGNDLLLRGQPVPLGDPDLGTAFTMQCTWRGQVSQNAPRILAIYPGHDPAGIDGPTFEGSFVGLADSSCNLLTTLDPAGGVMPSSPLLQSTATESDSGRLAMEIAGRMGTAALSSPLAVALEKLLPCSDCGKGGPENLVINDILTASEATNFNEASVSARSAAGSGGLPPGFHPE
jgi:hypothetical protein